MYTSMIYLEVNSVYNMKFRNGLFIFKPNYIYYSFMSKQIVTKLYYSYSGFQELRCLTVK